MSTREQAYKLIDEMTEEELNAFLMLFKSRTYGVDVELTERINDIENNRNLSKSFSTVEELMEDLNA